jgi:processive 1,2-diacylglycerol beta-glucosyltransferase
MGDDFVGASAAADTGRDPSRPYKVLLLYASFGSGHRRAAQAVQEALEERGIESEMQDLVAFLPAPLKSLYPWGYNFLINDWRFGWKFLYRSMDRSSRPYTPATSLLQKWQFTRLKRYLHDQHFTHIFSTHFTASALLTDWRKKKALDARIYSVVTDHIAHRCWKRTGLDHYFVASESVGRDLESAGIPSRDITVSGIPVVRAFRQSMTREQARAQWDCDPEQQVILALCSGWNLSKTMSILTEIYATGLQLRLLVSTGPDPAKEEKVRKRFEATGMKCTIFGFSTRIAEMMAASDLMISKPGGLIVSEALALGLPSLLFSPIPGQEEANAQYAERHGAAIRIPEQEGALGNILKEILIKRDKLEEMKNAAKEIGRPQAAVQIVESVFGCEGNAGVRPV